MSKDEPTFSAREVQDAAGLSYRQINDWDSRGALPHERRSDRSWRRFTPKELFVLMVCAEIRRKFGVPVSRLRYVREVMEREGANHLLAAAGLMLSHGLGVWLLTDLERTFIMDSELGFIDLMNMGAFGGNQENAYVFVKVNPLVNQLLEKIPSIGQLEAHGRGYEILRELRDQATPKSRAEAFVLEMIRSPDVNRVEITLGNGEIKTLKTSTNHDVTEQLVSLLEEEEYQRLTVIQKAGHIVSIEQQAVHKVED